MKHLHNFVFIAVLLFSVSLFAEDKWNGIKLLEIREDETESGEVMFSGSVKNNNSHGQNLRRPTVVITLKKEGVVVEVFRRSVEPTIERSWNAEFLEFEEVGTFEVVTLGRDQFDEYTIDFNAFPFGINPRLLKGEVHVIDSSVNFMMSHDERTRILGEVHNGTNAYISIEEISFDLLGENGDKIGSATGTPINTTNEIHPEETVSFEANSRIPFSRVHGWKFETVDFLALRLKESDTPTVQKGFSWGEIKERMLEE